MPGKARVHELAKELGVTSKQVLTQLESLGEFVKSASSTVEAPVARKLRDSMAGGNGGGESGLSKATEVQRLIPSPRRERRLSEYRSRAIIQ